MPSPSSKKFPLFSDTLASVGDHGIKVHGHYSNRLEHTAFMVLEADNFEQLDAAFDPILEMGNFEVTPIVKNSDQMRQPLYQSYWTKCHRVVSEQCKQISALA